jgi:ribosomal-protein-alanine N-acetyltransferase
MQEPEIPFLACPMQPVHLPAVMAIERTSFALPWPESAYRHEITQNELAHYYVLCFRDQHPVSSAGSTSVWQRLKGTIWRRAALQNELVLGYGGFWMMAGDAHISTLAMRLEARGRGLGELLLLSLLEEAHRIAAMVATLEVRVSNKVARALYTKYGFEQVGRRKAYYHDNGEDALIMTTPEFGSGNYWRMVAANRKALLARLAVVPEDDWQEL